MPAKHNPELVKYIENHLHKGFKIKQIRKTLEEVGHPVEAIEDALEVVFEQNPHLRKKPRFMVFYGVVLILLIIGFAVFVFFKTDAQAEYKSAVAELKQNQSYSALSDVELLKMAAESDDLKDCEFIKNHNTYYACVDKYWERGDCSYERIIDTDYEKCELRNTIGAELFDKYCVQFTSNDDCFLLIAFGEKDASYCYSRDGCLYEFALQNNDVTFCESLDFEKEECLMNIAIKQKNLSACYELKELSLTCEMGVLSVEDKAKKFNDFYKSYTKNGELSQEDFDDIFKDIITFYSEGICPGLIGSFKSHSFADLCHFYIVEDWWIQATITNRAETFDVVSAEKECSLITDPFLKSCCKSIMTERLINPECDFYDKTGD